MYTTTSFDQVSKMYNSPAYLIPATIICILTIIAFWKMFEKAGEAGWKSIIPFYNLYVELEIAGMSGWLFLLYLIPIVNIVLQIIVCVNIAKAYGKGTGYALGLIFLNTIFTLILGFGDAKYVGPKYGSK